VGDQYRYVGGWDGDVGSQDHNLGGWDRNLGGRDSDMGGQDWNVGGQDRDVGGQGGSCWGRDRIRGDGAVAEAAGAVRTTTGAAVALKGGGWPGQGQGPEQGEAHSYGGQGSG
jgi:hypothetical protein